MRKNQNGYDPSLDYGKYPTLTPLPQNLLAQTRETKSSYPRSHPVFQVSEGGGHTVILLPNGTVYAYGENEYGQCNVSDWRNMVSVIAGINSTVGLCADGTVKLVGEDVSDIQQHDSSSWRNITAIAGDGYDIFGLLPDGSWLKTDLFEPGPFGDNCVSIGYDGIFLFADGTVELDYCGQQHYEEIKNWRNIVKIVSSGNHIVGLCADGTVKAVCNDTRYDDSGEERSTPPEGLYGECQVSDWNNIRDISVSFHHTVGLCADGTVKATGRNTDGQCNVGHLRNVKAIAVSDFHTVTLLANGKVGAVGDFSETNRCNVFGWTDVAEIWATNDFTVARRHDGTFLCTDPEIQDRINAAL